MSTTNHSAPGVYSGRKLQPRNLFYSGQQSWFPSFAFIAGSLTRDPDHENPALLRAGLVLGKTTATGSYRNTIIGVTTADATNAATSITVSVAQAIEVQRLKTLGGGGNLSLKLIAPPTAGGTVATLALTVTAVNTATGVLTVSAIAAAAVTGSAVVPSDGAEVPSQFQTFQYGVDVVDLATGQSIDAQLRLLRSADINVANIVNYAGLDASVKTWLKAGIKASGVATSFSDDR